MSMLNVWEEASPFETPEKMVLLSELQTYSNALKKHEYKDHDNASVEPSSYSRWLRNSKEDFSRVISDRMVLLSDLVSSLRSNVESIGMADGGLKEISVGIHSLSLLLSRSGREKSANERLENIRAQLRHFDNLHNLLDYAQKGQFEDELTFIDNFRAAATGIRYFARMEKSTKSLLHINKYIECIKLMMIKLIELIKRDGQQEDLVRYTRMFSDATFGFPEFDAYLDDVLRVVYDSCKQMPQAGQVDLLKNALPLHFQNSPEK